MDSLGLKSIPMAIDSTKASFFDLTPDKVLHSVERHGYLPTGRYRVLNSYENRVFDIDCEDGSSIIVKFYRPHRWSKEALLEEHSFLQELLDEGLPVVPPLVLENNQTLWEHEGLWMSLFPKIRARMLDEIQPNQVPELGRWLARLHNVGSQRIALHRPRLQPSLERLELIEKHIPMELWNPYRRIAEDIFHYLSTALPQFQFIRVHGDFHRGNLLWNESWTLIDFDDFLMAPAAQDFWIILTQLSEEDQIKFVNAYQELREWNKEEQYLLEPLRAYRIIHYSTWIAERWDDPSFPHIFPGFHDYNFWANEILNLEKIVDPSKQT